MESAMTRWGVWATASAPRWPATTGFRRPPRIGPRRRQALGGVAADDDDGLPARAGGTVRDRSRNRPRRHGDRLSCDRQPRWTIGGLEAGTDRHRPRGARGPRGGTLGREAAGA